MKCPNCGYEFEGKFCPQCGTPINPQYSHRIKICLNCGEQLAENAIKCPACGADTNNSPVFNSNDTELISQIKSNIHNRQQPTPQMPMYQQPIYTAPQKKLNGGLKFVLIALGVIILVAIISSIVGGNKGNNNSSITSSVSNLTSSSKVSQSASKPSDTIKPSDKDITNIDYKKLYTDYSQYKDKYVRIAGIVSSLGKNITGVNYVTIQDGLGGGINMVYVNFQNSVDTSKLKKGDYVLIVGKVGTMVIGTLNLDQSYIESTGDSAKSKYDEYAKASAQADAAALTKYKSSCQTYKYKDIARNPDTYKNKPAKFTGKVIQVMESGSSVTLRVNVTKGEYDTWSDTIYVEYTRKSDTESRILENDIITMYGELNGIKTYTTVLKSEMSIPYLVAKYIDIQK